ncbi:hypothetical protein ACKVMI_08980 [Paenimyroides ceti]
MSKSTLYRISRSLLKSLSDFLLSIKEGSCLFLLGK